MKLTTDRYISEEWTVNQIQPDMNIYELKLTLKQIPLKKFFGVEGEKFIISNIRLYTSALQEYLEKYLTDEMQQHNDFRVQSIAEQDGRLICAFCGSEEKAGKTIMEGVRSYYETNASHITRMFGSYILLSAAHTGSLEAVYATEIPISYCPLMFKLLKEVGGKTGERLIAAMQTEQAKERTPILLRLINEVVIHGGYFDTGRALNSCEANVAFGASETIYSAFNDGLLDAAVIVSNNLGTIITTNAEATQGAVKRMTGLFYTSPSSSIIKTAYKANIIPVFPYTATIDQIAGVKKAIDLGYKKIAVTLASTDNILLSELDAIQKEYNVKLYKFALCSTGISEQTAEAMKQYADIVWSCASKQISVYIEPNSIAQVGIKIPVHIMTQQGWELVECHLKHMDGSADFDMIQPTTGDKKPVFLNDENGIRAISKKDLLPCEDCPYPCI